LLDVLARRWRGRERVILFVTAVAGDASLLGAKTLNARQVERLWFAARGANSSTGTLDQLLAPQGED
jgi:hypothetical protein